MPIYSVKKGEYKKAVEQILRVMADPNGEPIRCDCENQCQGCQYEMEEAVVTCRAALGLPVPRQRCDFCGALDQIWWDKHDPEWRCRACGGIVGSHQDDPKERHFTWVKEPVV